MNMIYSNSLGCMVQSGFTAIRVVFDDAGVRPYSLKKAYHWTWNDDDCVYYRDDVDYLYTDEVIKNGCISYVLQAHCHARYLIKCD